MVSFEFHEEKRGFMFYKNTGVIDANPEDELTLHAQLPLLLRHAAQLWSGTVGQGLGGRNQTAGSKADSKEQKQL